MRKYGEKYFLKNGKKYLQSVQEYYIIKTVRTVLLHGGVKNVNQRIFKEDQPDNEGHKI